jgi:Protein of unknown function (DUF2911)
MRKVFNTVFVLFVLAAIAFAQGGDKKAPASPPGTASYSFPDGKKITIEYSRPYVKGRKIMGGLVPYGQVWRTGANSATSFTTDTDLVVGGTTVPAGKYTLYTLPGESGWKLIINKETGQWGTKYDEKQDLARVDMQVAKTSAPVEQFTISFDKPGGDATKLKLDWENTSASVDIREKK